MPETEYLSPVAIKEADLDDLIHHAEVVGDDTTELREMRTSQRALVDNTRGWKMMALKAALRYGGKLLTAVLARIASKEAAAWVNRHRDALADQLDELEEETESAIADAVRKAGASASVAKQVAKAIAFVVL